MKQIPRPKPVRDLYMLWAVVWTLVCLATLSTVGILQPESSDLRPMSLLLMPTIALPFLASSLLIAHWCRPVIRLGKGHLFLPIAVVVTFFNVTLFSLLTIVTTLGLGAGMFVYIVLSKATLIVLTLGLTSQFVMKHADKAMTRHA